MKNRITWLKALIVSACVAHFTYLIVAVFTDDLGPNPIESLTHVTGEWGLRLLLLTLAITPLRRLLHWNSLARFRRLLGLCSFVYICAHFAIFLVFDHFFDWLAIINDIFEHPYISVGFIAFILMLPLAITSVNSLQRKMGKSWLSLHKSVYLVGILAIIHYWWLVKADVLLPLVYGAILACLFLIRGYFFIKKRWPLWLSKRLSKRLSKSLSGVSLRG
jgi:sulfoxide reductase heme-binding subunit YedZ